MRHTEYGGGPGSPARRPDGSGKPLSAAERARIVRQQVARDLPSYTEPRVVHRSDGTSEVSTADAEAIADLNARTNGYSAEMTDGNGDTGTGQVVS